MADRFFVTSQNLDFKYPEGKYRVLKNISLQIPLGSVYGLVGPNGAGKTTLFRILCGRLRPEKGAQITFYPQLCEGDPPHIRKSALGVLLENPGVYEKLTVGEYLDFFCRFYPNSMALNRRLEMSHRMDLGDLSQKIHQLSLGNRQKLQILRCLCIQPEILLLDEPTANLDPSSREQIWEIIREVAETRGVTVVVASHVLSEVEQYCSHVGMLHSGHLLAQGPLDFVLGNVTRLEFKSFKPIHDNLWNDIRSAFPHADWQRSRYTLSGNPGGVQEEIYAVIIDMMIRNGCVPVEMGHKRKGLHAVFMEMMKNHV